MMRTGRSAVLLFLVLVSVWIPKETLAKDFSLHAAIHHGREVQLQWDKCPDASGYLVLRGGDKDESGVPVITLGADSTKYTDTTLALGDTAYYQVEAVFPENGAGLKENPVVTNRCKIYLSGKGDTPVLHVKKQGSQLKFRANHLKGSEAIYLYGKKKGGKYRLYSITRDSYQLFVNKNKASFSLKAQNVRGTYFFRVRSYNMVKGKKVYSNYSPKVTVYFSS